MNPLQALKSAIKLEKLTLYAYDYVERSQKQKQQNPLKHALIRRRIPFF